MHCVQRNVTSKLRVLPHMFKKKETLIKLKKVKVWLKTMTRAADET